MVTDNPQVPLFLVNLRYLCAALTLREASPALLLLIVGVYVGPVILNHCSAALVCREIVEVCRQISDIHVYRVSQK